MNADDSPAAHATRFEVAEHLNHPAVARAFLWNAVATGDAETIRRAEAAVAQARKRNAWHD